MRSSRSLTRGAWSTRGSHSINTNEKKRSLPVHGDEGREMLRVRCWCERSIVEVSAEDVNNGLTGPCKKLVCQEIDDTQRSERHVR